VAKASRVISPEHLAKLQAAAKAARKSKAAAGKTCGDCGAKVKPRDGNEPYVRSSTRPGVIYCWPGTGCWITGRKGEARTRADL
jgi:hypothetical protein